MTEQEIKEHLTWCMYISEDLHKTRLEILYPYIGTLTKIFIHQKYMWSSAGSKSIS